MTDLRDLLRMVVVIEDMLDAGRDLTGAALVAERSGATAVLLQVTNASPRDLALAARALQGRVGVPLLIHSRADVAIAVGARGVHLGPDDVPVPLVRRVAPRGFLIGASVGSIAEVEIGRGADYWVIGPWSGLGATGFSALVRRAEGRPCLATGGVDPADLETVLAVGGSGVMTGEA